MTASLRSIVVHGHFYQPPREDPWFDEVSREPTAAPFHDWNERIEHECYGPIVAARPLEPDGPSTNPSAGSVTGRATRPVNALASISFDVGPTLLDWLERHAHATYEAMLEADRASRRARSGHGNAIAAPYHHVILPLASRRDKRTEVRWGIADFQRRFGRDPMGMWLPETAVDDETLDVLAAEGIAFTILASHQVVRPPANGLPGLYRTGGGRSIALFLYDGDTSHDIAFGPLIGDATLWAERMTARRAPPGETGPHLLTVATDGETYGHHHRGGERTLATVLADLQLREEVLLENPASFLVRHAPREEVELVAPSSWSCPHGVERWRADCGCRMAPERQSQQRWRAPLRDALEWLAVELNRRFEHEGSSVFGDPWRARDAYGAFVGSGEGERGSFVRHAIAGRPADAVRALELLEMERNCLRMFTSCGWFFDDLGGLEGTQVLRYAARAIDLAGRDGDQLEEGLLERLARAPVGEPESESGAELYRRRVKPRVAPAVAAAGGYAAARSLGAEPEELLLAGLDVHERPDGSDRNEFGARLDVVERRTGRVHRLVAQVERPGAGRILAHVRPAETNGGKAADVEPADVERTEANDMEAIEVEMADFPEKYLAVVTRRLGEGA